MRGTIEGNVISRIFGTCSAYVKSEYSRYMRKFGETMSSSITTNMLPVESREAWWDRANRLDSLSTNGAGNSVESTSGSSFSSSLESLLARSDAFAVNDGARVNQAAPTSVTGDSVTFEELINSQNAQIREFAVLDQQPLSQDWSVLGNVNPVTPSNFKALDGLSDGLMLSQRFANAIYAV